MDWPEDVNAEVEGEVEEELVEVAQVGGVAVGVEQRGGGVRVADVHRRHGVPPPRPEAEHLDVLPVGLPRHGGHPGGRVVHQRVRRRRRREEGHLRRHARRHPSHPPRRRAFARVLAAWWWWWVSRESNLGASRERRRGEERRRWEEGGSGAVLWCAGLLLLFLLVLGSVSFRFSLCLFPFFFPSASMLVRCGWVVRPLHCGPSKIIFLHTPSFSRHKTYVNEFRHTYMPRFIDIYIHIYIYMDNTRKSCNMKRRKYIDIWRSFFSSNIHHRNNGTLYYHVSK